MARTSNSPEKQSPTLRVEGLTKSYGDLLAVSDLSFQVEPGEILGLVGMNGAGKTTTLRSLSGLLTPTRGFVYVGEMDIRLAPTETRRMMAYIPDTVHAFEFLTVLDHLRFVSLSFNLPDDEARYDRLLEEMQLSGKKHAMASTLSRGMLQKLSLCTAFLRNPAIVVLDEPLTGLDPKGIRDIKDSILRRAAEGMSFVLSSHLLELVEALCDRVLIMHKGRRVACGSIDEIRHMTQDGGSSSFEDVFLAITEQVQAVGK